MCVGERVFEDIHKIGIIGTKGKTTTAKLIIDLLNKNKIRGIHLKGSQLFGDDKKEKPEFQQIIDKIQNDKIQVAIIELAHSHLEKAINNNFQCDSIIHTNTFISEEANISNNHYLEIINKKPFKLLSKNGTAIINIDDKYHTQIVEGIGNNIVVSYGLCSKATLTASSIEASSSIGKFICCLQRGITDKNNIEVDPMEFPVNTHIQENYNIQNSLAAIAQVLLLGVSPDIINNLFCERKKYSL